MNASTFDPNATFVTGDLPTQQRLLRRAMSDSDSFVVELEYLDSKGTRTRRMVSPIRFVGGDRFLGLCLCRQEPRQFQLSRCRDVRLVAAEDVLMPVEIVEIPRVDFASAS